MGDSTAEKHKKVKKMNADFITSPAIIMCVCMQNIRFQFLICREMRRFYSIVFVKLFPKSLWALGKAQGLNPLRI